MERYEELRKLVIQARTPTPFVVPEEALDILIELCKRECLLDLLRELEDFKTRK